MKAVWTTEIPTSEGWYGLHYTLEGKLSAGERPMIEFLSTEDLEDYKSDLGVDPDLDVWFYGPLTLEMTEFDGKSS